MLSVSPAREDWFEQKPDPAVSMIDLTGPSGKVTIGTVHVMDDKSIMADISGALPPGTTRSRGRQPATTGMCRRASSPSWCMDTRSRADR